VRGADTSELDAWVAGEDSDDAPRATRRPLSDIGGPTTTRGNAGYAALLSAAMRAVEGDAGEAVREDLTHGFHSYPARMHPAIARTLVNELHEARRTKLVDPFCGSGTVIVEGVAAGMRTLGSDLNPLALQLTRVKTRLTSEAERIAFVRTAEAIGERSEARVRERVPVLAKLSKEEIAWYEPHVLKELAGLLEEIRKEKHAFTRETLELVFSAIVVKFSRQQSDTRETVVDRRIRKGLVTEFFVRKAEELAARWEIFADAVPPKTPPPTLLRTDARVLPETLGGKFTADLVITSPPYAGTYDYARHHARRAAWLGFSLAPLERGEIGARRTSTSGDAGLRWRDDVEQVLLALAELVVPDGFVVMLVGDGEMAGRRIPADALLEGLAADCGFESLAVASQPRVDWKGGAGRSEHLVALRRLDDVEGRPRKVRAPPRQDPPPERRGPARTDLRAPSRDEARGTSRSGTGGASPTRGWSSSAGDTSKPRAASKDGPRRSDRPSGTRKRSPS
jgi:hypothetical protein